RSVPIAPRSFRYRADAATGVATLTLDRPERLNSLTFGVYAELRDTFAALDAESGVRAIVLTGSGRGFCSGGDVDHIIGPLLERAADGLLDFPRRPCAVIARRRAGRRPIVAAVNGIAAGAGAVLATACDFRIAAETAKIAFLFTRVGLSGADMGASWMLPRIVGLGRATELLMTGEVIGATRALEIGLYPRVVTAERVVPEATALAETLAAGPARALTVTKRALEAEATMSLDQALAYEAEAQAMLMEHPDFREAYQAFVQEREPR